MDAPPKIKTETSFFESLSLKKTAPQSIESKITHMFSVGKKMALGSNPASVVFSKLQQPKQKPTQDATASFCGRRRDVLFFFEHNAKSREAPAASKNAINKKIAF